jgi:hypothetical protein
MKRKRLTGIVLFIILIVFVAGCWPFGPRPIKDKDGIAGFRWTPPENADQTVHKYEVYYWVNGKRYTLETNENIPFIGIQPQSDKETIDSVKTAGVNAWGETGETSDASEKPVKVYR